MPAAARKPLRIFVVAGEESGDQLGFKLIRALREARPGGVEFAGVGGAAMAAEGLKSLFPLSDIAVMGFVAPLLRLPTLLQRIGEAARACVTFAPDVLVIVDSPDFTHRVARRVRRALPRLPIVDYVSPSVWAWRPGRARRMRAYVDEVLALLPFEPDAYRRLGGPACTYVGHPLVERLDELRGVAQEQRMRDASPPLLLVLPGSRRSEIDRLMPVFGAALALLRDRFGPFEVALPAVDRHAARIETLARHWRIRPQLLHGDPAKFAAFRQARAALAASGTVTLELALARVPTVVAYRLAGWELMIARRLIAVQSIVLPNLILNEKAVPEFIQDDGTPDALAAALSPLLQDGAERAKQLSAFSRLDPLMRPAGLVEPSTGAANRVLSHAEKD